MKLKMVNSATGQWETTEKLHQNFGEKSPNKSPRNKPQNHTGIHD